jgi:hypothetical protein
MPGEQEFSRAALDRSDDLIGDVLVNVEAFGLHGGSPLADILRLIAELRPPPDAAPA